VNNEFQHSWEGIVALRSELMRKYLGRHILVAFISIVRDISRNSQVSGIK